MLGTIVNSTAIVLGSALGSTLKHGISDRYKDVMMQTMGLAAAALGINSVVNNLPDSNYPVLFIASLAIGGVLGEKIDIDSRFNHLVDRFSTGNLAQGLSTAILLFCIGALSILGPIQSALNGDNTYLFTNAMLDFVTSTVLASNFGIGIALAAVVLFAWQGSIYGLASLIADYVTPELLTELSVLGGILIFSSGLSILEIKKIKTMNLIPALIVPPVFVTAKTLLFHYFG